MSTITYEPPSQAQRLVVAVLVLLGLVAAVAVPSFIPEDFGHNENSHLWNLVQHQQPWNALLFFGVPFGLTVVLAITEMMVMFDGGRRGGWSRRVRMVASLLAGPVMLALAAHLALHEVGPHAHRPLALPDLLSLVAYGLQVVPLGLVTLSELRMVGKDRRDARRLHAMGVGAQLIVMLVTIGLAILQV